MPRNNHIPGWKLAVFTSAGGALVFVMFGGISTGFSTRNVILLAVAGALFGAIAAPDLEPKAFRYPEIWQMFFSILGGILVAAKFEAGPIGYLIAVVVGGVLGFHARHWTKHINPP